jgi:hypothetical protein
MLTSPRTLARRWLLGGFTLIAASSIYNFVHGVDYGVFDLTFSSSLQLILAPAQSLVTLWAWLWLSKVEVTGDEQRALMRKAFYGLAVAHLMVVVSIIALMSELWPSPFANVTSIAQWWLEALGGGAAFVGFVLMARLFVAPTGSPVATDEVT